jgi:hypothetical protein
LIRNPILKVLSSIRAHRVRALLMGGQACVFYGAAEFSRDTDFAILANPENLARLRSALDELQAEVIAVPPFEAKYLRKGHAVHFGVNIPMWSACEWIDDQNAQCRRFCEAVEAAYEH